MPLLLRRGKADRLKRSSAKINTGSRYRSKPHENNFLLGTARV
jgi:hypothetical protein